MLTYTPTMQQIFLESEENPSPITSDKLPRFSFMEQIMEGLHEQWRSTADYLLLNLKECRSVGSQHILGYSDGIRELRTSSHRSESRETHLGLLYASSTGSKAAFLRRSLGFLSQQSPLLLTKLSSISAEMFLNVNCSYRSMIHLQDNTLFTLAIESSEQFMKIRVSLCPMKNPWSLKLG